MIINKDFDGSPLLSAQRLESRIGKISHEESLHKKSPSKVFIFREGRNIVTSREKST